MPVCQVHDIQATHRLLRDKNHPDPGPAVPLCGRCVEELTNEDPKAAARLIEEIPDGG